jgi:hypothetical protein
MALRANALTSIATVKTQLDIPSGDTSQDSFLERLINSSSQQIEMFCNRPFVSASFTEYYDANRTNEIMLKKAGVTAITSVYLDSSRVWAADSLVDASEYGFMQPNLLRKYSGTWGAGTQILKVTYTAGYIVIPADVEDACIMLVEQRYRRKNDRQSNKTSQSKVNESVSYLTEWSPEILSLLEPYRVLNFLSGNMAVMQ